MTMNTAFYKEHDSGIALNQMGSLSSSPGAWWSGLVTQSTFDEAVARAKPSSMESHSSCGELLAPITPKSSDRGVDQVLEKGTTTHSNAFPGYCKNSANKQPIQIQAAFSLQSVPPEYRGQVELGFGQPAICSKYPYADQCYGVFSTYGPQLTGRIMLPFNLSTDEGPIFVNAKQYNGIMRRRRSRAKAEMANKVSKNRKPFLHLSRHLHAMRRPRGCGGRFLNTKKMDKFKDEKVEQKKSKEGCILTSLPSGSQCSEVLQSDISNLTSPREANGNRSNISGSEVTTVLSMGDLNHFPISLVSLSEMMTSGNVGHNFGMSSKWASAAAAGGGSRCNLAI